MRRPFEAPAIGSQGALCQVLSEPFNVSDAKNALTQS